jgi:hypothetical protein
MPDGRTQLAGTGRRGATNQIFAVTNISLPIDSWLNISTGKFSGGVFSFIDAQATNTPQRFYHIRAN